MAGRNRKLDKQMIEKLSKVIRTGVTIEDACAHVGIAVSTFYHWHKTGRKAQDVLSKSADAPIRDYARLCLEFLESVTRAEADARVHAVAVVRGAMSDQIQITETTETITETRINPKTGEKYDYIKTVTKHTKTTMPPEWRAAVEFLKRRDPENWSDRLRIDTWQTEAIKLIQSGDISFRALAGELGEPEARQLFLAADVPIDGEAEDIIEGVYNDFTGES